jgi:hypothetical protein
MPMREERYMSFYCAHSWNYPIDPSAHLLRAFPTRTPVPEKQPTGRLRANLLRGQSFVFAVVPFHEIAIDFSALAQTG